MSKAERGVVAGIRTRHYYLIDEHGFGLGPACGAPSKEDDWIPAGLEAESKERVCFACRKAKKAGARVASIRE